MKFVLTPPGSPRPNVIVETHATVSKRHEDALRTAMYSRNCANGLLFDATNCVVLRDTYDDMGPEAIRVEHRLETVAVLSLVEGNTLDERVQTWLELLSASWHHALPQDQASAPLMYDLVPAAVGTEIHILGDQE